MDVPSRPVPGRLHRAVETLANLGIVVVAILGSASLINELRATPAAQTTRSAPRLSAPAPEVGSRLALTGANWAGRERTLVLVLSTTCRFCSDSMPFYQRIAAEAKRTAAVHLTAVFPQSADAAKRYLAQAGLAVDEVLQVPMASLGLRGTPTLVLVDSQGVIVRVWPGRLPAALEAEVLDAVKATSRQ